MEMIPWWKIKINKENLKQVNNSFKSKLFSEGVITKKLETKIKKYLKVKHVIATTSGTSAILLILIYLQQKYKFKNEIIISNRSWISPAHSCHILGLKLHLVDVKKNYPIANEEKIIQSINKKTLAIICVQLNGKSVDISKIKKSKNYKKYKPFILEDSAQSFSSKHNGKFIGTFGDAGILSFSMGKIVSSGQGGAIITDDNLLDKKLRLIKNNGIINRYTDRWNTFGLNFKFTDIQASLLLKQIDKINFNVKKLKSLYKFYENNLKNTKSLSLIYTSKDFKHGWVPLYVECLSSKRDKILNILKKNKIQARKIYPSLNSTKYLTTKGKKFQESEKFNKNLFYLPSGPDQDKNSLKKIFEIIKNYENRTRQKRKINQFF